MSLPFVQHMSNPYKYFGFLEHTGPESAGGANRLTLCVRANPFDPQSRPLILRSLSFSRLFD